MKRWEEFLEHIASEMGVETVEKWAKPLRVVYFDAGNLYLEAQNTFQVTWFEHHVRPRAPLFLRNNKERPIKIHLSLANAPAPQEKKPWKPAFNLSPDSLQADCYFDSYFPGATNEVPFSLLKEALQQSLYNPVYLQGPEGVGKTHLLMACAFFLKSKNKKCFYVKASTFTQHLVAAIRSSSMHKLRGDYRKHDVLLIDNIDELAHRTATQEEFFHTFNALHVAGKQMIFAGRGHPSAIEGIEPRLTSRFEWGLLLHLQPLSKLELRQWLLKKCGQKKIALAPEAASFLLEELPALPLLSSALETLPSGSVSQEEVKKRIEALLETWKKKLITAEKIISATAEAFEINPSDMLGRSQSQNLSLPRQIAMYLCRKKLALPFTKIAHIFSRDHSTVMTSVKTIEKKMKELESAAPSHLHAVIPSIVNNL